jgi:hypothetical protein
MQENSRDSSDVTRSATVNMAIKWLLNLWKSFARSSFIPQSLLPLFSKAVLLPGIQNDMSQHFQTSNCLIVVFDEEEPFLVAMFFSPIHLDFFVQDYIKDYIYVPSLLPSMKI